MSDQQWHYNKDNTQHGPVTEQILSDMLSRGELEPTALIWTAGMSHWKPANLVPGFPVSLPEATAATGNRRPTVGTVFGILGIVFGGLGLLCMPFAFIGLFMNKQNQAFSETVQIWTMFSYGLGVVSGILQLVLGIGLLKMKIWARKWFVIYGWSIIAWSVISVAITLLLANSGHYGTGPQKIGAMIGGGIGGIAGLIYPILIVIFLSRDHVKTAYEG